MQQIKFMFEQLFLKEPLWFKIVISSTLLISIIFSSSSFSNTYYQSFSKLAAAIFLGAYGIKMRRNRLTSVIFFAAAVMSIYLSWHNLELARL